MAYTRTQLNGLLAEMGITTVTVDHPAVHTVADSSAVDLGLSGAHTKNLFLKDDKGKLFLVIAESGTKVDLKALSRRLGAGRFSFGKPELLDSVLGVSAGSVTAFAVVNDGDRRVSVVIDQELAAYDRVNCHPLENTATTNIALEDLLRFIRATGHELQFMNLNAT